MIKTSPFIRVLASFAACAVLSLPLVGCGGGGGAAASGGATDASGAQDSLIGKPAPAVNAEFVTGEGPKTLEEGKGRVVILDFWGTFCEPCKKSFPKYQELVDQFGGDLAVLAVSVDDPEDTKKEALEEFAKETGAKFTIVWDKDHKAAETYKPPTMPSSFVIDKDGVVRHMHVGFKEGEEAELDKEVKELLGK